MVIAHAAVGDVKFALGIVAEHGAVAHLADKVEIGRPLGRGWVAQSCGILVVEIPEEEIIAAGQSGDEVFLQIRSGEGLLAVVMRRASELIPERPLQRLEKGVEIQAER